MSAFLNHLVDVGSPPAGGLPPQVGDRVQLRQVIGTAEAWSESGRRLGRLPPTEQNLLASLGLHPLAVRIAAVVPRPGATHADRVLLQVEAA
jgi:hypothetical protein